MTPLLKVVRASFANCERLEAAKGACWGRSRGSEGFKGKPSARRSLPRNEVERETGIEPATFSLEG
jgi:hypothetical protein